MSQPYTPGTFPEIDGKKVIDIIATADTICPFCYLGYTKVSQAIKQAEDQNLPVKISIRFAPFQLDPALTDKPITKLERMSQKFGPDRFKQIEVMMKQRFIDTGLPEPTSDMLIRQTTRSHRLVWKAGQIGGPQLQNTIVGTLYEKHFIDGKDVGDIEGYLSDVAVDHALFKTKADAVEWLNGEEGLPEYQEAIKKAQRMGISGVPFWTINGKFAISGAQEPETFYEIFKSIADGSFHPQRGY